MALQLRLSTWESFRRQAAASFTSAGRADLRALQKQLISAENFVTRDDEGHFVDFGVDREEFASRVNGNPRCFPNRITIRTATDRRKGNGLDSIFDRELQ